MTAPTLATREMVVLTALRVVLEATGPRGHGLPAKEIAAHASFTTQATVLALHALKAAGLVGCSMARFEGQRRLCWHLTAAGVHATNPKVKEQ